MVRPMLVLPEHPAPPREGPQIPALSHLVHARTVILPQQQKEALS
jgi:hypothetical protein